jgi:signal transduction histidine kinase
MTERAGLQADAQLQALVEASLALTTELALDRVLDRIAHAAREVLRARYAALGVINESGTGLSRFLTAGVDEATAAAIGPLPAGQGVLGLLIREGRPIRIPDISQHPGSAGFPPHHPPMRSFLGVPITVRGKAYGNLYVTEKQGAPEFSEADERIALMLASQAGIVIENALAFQALEAAQEELVRKERLATLGQLAGSVGHELRNPLGVIKNSVYFLGMVLPHDEKIRKHLGILEREVGNANRIVSDLLDFARVKSPARVPTDLNELVRAALEVSPVPDSVEVRAELADGLPAPVVDPQQVRHIVANLFSNAVQAMPDGGTLTVRTGMEATGPTIAVTDTGIGIPPENLGRIFQPLFTTKAKGIGLGLALAQDFAGANHAVITVDSTPGGGSTFTLRFHESAERG